MSLPLTTELMKAHNHQMKTLKENHLQKSINLAKQPQSTKELVDSKARQLHEFPESNII